MVINVTLDVNILLWWLDMIVINVTLDVNILLWWLDTMVINVLLFSHRKCQHREPSEPLYLKTVLTSSSKLIIGNVFE